MEEGVVSHFFSAKDSNESFWRGLWPLGSVTSQTLHSFILQGQIPVTEPGGQKRQACWVVLTVTLSLSDKMKMSKHEDDINQQQNYGRQTWSSGSCGRAVGRSVDLIRRQPATAINGLKSNAAWATHYPPRQNYTLTWGRFISYPLVKLVLPYQPPFAVQFIWITRGADWLCCFVS